MKWFAVLMLFTQVAWSSETCTQIRESLKQFEINLHGATLYECKKLTPQSLKLPALSEQELAMFEAAKCQNFANLDLHLGALENQLVLLDGLKDLRDQTIAAKSTLQSATNWTAKQSDLAAKFTRDVTLGATIQHIVESPLLPDLFSVETSGPKWGIRLDDFCKVSKNVTSPVCGMWKSFTHPSAIKAIEVNELFSFLDDLKTLLDDKRQIPAAKRAELLSLLKLKQNQQATDFKKYQESLDQAKMYDFVSGKPPKSLNAQQTKFLRAEKLELPAVDANHDVVRNLIARLNKNKDMMQVKNAQDLFQSTVTDASNRLEARIKSRWASLYQNRFPTNAAIPCAAAKDDTLTQCLSEQRKNFENIPRPLTKQEQDLYDDLINSSEQLRKNRVVGERCQRVDVIQAHMKGDVVPPECDQDRTLSYAGFELKRQVMLALRNRLRDQEEKDVRFRAAAFSEMKKHCANEEANTIDFAASPACLAMPGSVPFGAAILLASDTMAIFNEGTQPNREISTADCPAGGPEGVQDKYTTICNIIFNRDRPSTAGAGTPPRVTPETLSTDAPRRETDPIVRESLVNAVSDIANTWANVRMRQMQSSVPSWGMPTYRPMPYSQPITMSMSDYVMTTATVYGGYGRYYNCPTCGVGAGAAFGNYWGVSTPVAGMGNSALGGTSLSSRFFGGTTGSSAGFFSF